MKRRMASLLLVSIFSACFVRAASTLQQTDKRIEQLQKQRQKLKREKDPVGHTKTQIEISEILLTFVADAIKNADFDEMQKQLDEYCAVIDDALQTMMNTGRDANRHPSGFKDLEIALRRQTVKLDGFGQALTYDHREPVLKAKASASGIRDRLIKALLIEDIHARTGKS